MPQMQSKSIGFPILLVFSACIVAVFVYVFSLGLFLPLSATIVGLSLVLSGVWLLLNRSSRTSRILATALVCAPFLVVVMVIFRSQAMHG